MFGRSGNDLLSRALRRSTISAKGFNGRVRNGIGWDTFAIITRSSNHTHKNLKKDKSLEEIIYTQKRNQANQTISIS